MKIFLDCRTPATAFLYSVCIFAVCALFSTSSAARDIRFATQKTYPAAVSGASCIASGDLNGDGYPDLAVTDHINAVSVLINRGDGTFRTATSFSLQFYVIGCVAVGDFNSDKILDLLVVGGDESGDGVAVLTGKGDGTFNPPTYSLTAITGGSISVAIADLNHDGSLDLFVGGNGSSETVIGDGKGDFSDGEYEPAYGFGVVLGDFNGDGALDAATTGPHTSEVNVFLGNGDGTFQAPQGYEGIEFSPFGITAGDFDHDGHLDLAVTLYDGASVLLMLGKGDGTFTIADMWFVDLSPGGVVAEDFNKDGNLDLATSNFDGNDVGVLQGRGDGQFPQEINLPVGNNPAHLASADFNRDGSPDIAVTNFADNTVSVLFNAAGTVLTLGSSPNPSRVGEPVTFEVRVKASVAQQSKPTGAIVFGTGSQHTPPIPLVNGIAKFKTGKLPAGAYRIAAKYLGDAMFNPNTSGPIVQKVEP